MTEPKQPPMPRDEALVTMFKELQGSIRAGNERTSGAYRQLIADLIDPPRAGQIIGGAVSYAHRPDGKPHPRRSATAAELAEVYAALSTWARDKGDTEQAAVFDAARAEIGKPDTVTAERMPELLASATRTLAPGWTPPAPPDLDDRAAAIVVLYRAMVDAFVEGDMRIVDACQQSLVDLIGPPQGDLAGPDTTPSTAAEVREVYQRLREWADEIPDPEAADRFAEALRRLDQLGDLDDLSSAQQSSVVEDALLRLVPDWTPPRSGSIDAVRTARRGLGGGPESPPDTDPEAAAHGDAAGRSPGIRRAQGAGPDGPKGPTLR